MDASNADGPPAIATLTDGAIGGTAAAVAAELGPEVSQQLAGDAQAGIGPSVLDAVTDVVIDLGQPVPPRDAVSVKAASARGRWRIGRHFGQMPSVLFLDELEDGDVERLEADPELHVSLVSV